MYIFIYNIVGDIYEGALGKGLKLKKYVIALGHWIFLQGITFLPFSGVCTLCTCSFNTYVMAHNYVVA